MRFHGVLSAAALLTRVPVPRGTHTGDLRVAAPWMPVIGAGIGGVSAIACIAFQRLGSGVAAVAAVSTSIILTGCLHEDGLADTADALGGAGTRERLFEILKDSRVGAFGAVAIALSLMWRTLLIDRLGQDAAGAIVVAHTIGRLATVWIMGTLEYVTPSTVARNRDAHRLGVGSVLRATMAATAILLIVDCTGLLPTYVCVVSGVSFAVVAAVLARYFKHRCGGYTGDFLGATEQVGECWTLLICAVAAVMRGPRP